MKVAFISDIHGNMPAWRAVLDDIRGQQVERVLCLGDVVGYGPMSREVLSSVQAVSDGIIIGNHEAAAAGLLDLSIFNDYARDMILWTAEVLGRETREDFATWATQLEFDAGGYLALCVHSNAHEPMEFDYILDENDARDSLDACTYRLVLVGHSHIARADVLRPDGKVVSVAPDTLRLRKERRYVLNIGSVGMSRDGDSRACYAVLDTDTQTFTWRRIAYDLEALRRDIEDGPWSAEHAAAMRESFAHLWETQKAGAAAYGRTLVLREARAFHLGQAQKRREYAQHTHSKAIFWSLFSFVVLSLLITGITIRHYATRPRQVPVQVTESAPDLGIRPYVPRPDPPPVTPPPDPRPDPPPVTPPPVVRPDPPSPTPPVVRPDPPPVTPPPVVRPDPPPPATEGIWQARLGESAPVNIQWTAQASWDREGFPHGPGARAVLHNTVSGTRTINIRSSQDVTVGVLRMTESTNCNMYLHPGFTLTFDNGMEDARWVRHKNSLTDGGLRLIVSCNLHLVSTVQAEWSLQRHVELNTQISGPGGLIINHHANESNADNRRVSFRGQPNTYSGGTELNGRVSANRQSIFIAEKNGAFGTGNVLVNEFAQLVLPKRGDDDDMISDSAALGLVTNDQGHSIVVLAKGVNERVGALFINGERQLPGTYGSERSAARFVHKTLFAGEGILTVGGR